MNRKIIAALGAIALLALGSAVADARSLGGGGGGHIGGGGGAHFSGGGGHVGGGHFSGGRMGGGNFAARSFRSGPSFGGQSFRNQSFRGPRVAGFDRSFRGRPGRVANFNGGRWHGDRHEHHRRGSRFFFAGVPYYYGYYDDYGYGGDDCGWLYRRAIQTGSPYWWQRYQVCEG
jgi:hypothetical protein